MTPPTLCPDCACALIKNSCPECGRRFGATAAAQPKPAASAAQPKPAASTAPISAASGDEFASLSQKLSGSHKVSGSRRQANAAGPGTASQGTGSTPGTRTRRNQLGGGLVALPPMPSIDPDTLVKPDMTIPARDRYCKTCADVAPAQIEAAERTLAAARQGGDAASIRAAEEQLAYATTRKRKKLVKDKGFCTDCGTSYSFVPSLQQGDLVAGQYLIKGPIAHGSLGWIFLAQDQRLARPCVLKGMVNAKDPESAAVAAAERQFLATLKHPKIVSVYNFVTHGSVGYIVMELVTGRMLRDVVHEQPGEVLEPEAAIAYILGILPAFQYIHDNGMLYCDFKPQNFMVEGGDVKLIDLGAMRLIQDEHSAIFGDSGYMAPEMGDETRSIPLSPATDIYTIGRTLHAMLVQPWLTDEHGAIMRTPEGDPVRTIYTKYRDRLASPAEEPVLAQHDELYRWLQRATRAAPDARFRNVDEAQAQLYGVLRAVVARRTGKATSIESEYFLGETVTDTNPDTASRLVPLQVIPTTIVDAEDPAAAKLQAAAHGDAKLRLGLLNQIQHGEKRSAEVSIRIAEAEIELGELDAARRSLDRAEALAPEDWRVEWYRGRLAIAAGTYDEAYQRFARAYLELPGELAPKLAMAVASELKGDDEKAARLYGQVAATDRDFSQACFGLARCRAATRERDKAAEAYKLVKETSVTWPAARLGMAKLLATPDLGDPSLEQLKEAAETVGSLTFQSLGLRRTAADILLTAARAIETGRLKADRKTTLLGTPFEPRALRFKAEAALLDAATLALDAAQRTALVDEAYRERPWTRF
jgi:serine/threonine-protein kinase PknG